MISSSKVCTWKLCPKPSSIPYFSIFSGQIPCSSMLACLAIFFRNPNFREIQSLLLKKFTHLLFTLFLVIFQVSLRSEQQRKNFYFKIKGWVESGRSFLEGSKSASEADLSSHKSPCTQTIQLKWRINFLYIHKKGHNSRFLWTSNMIREEIFNINWRGEKSISQCKIYARIAHTFVMMVGEGGVIIYAVGDPFLRVWQTSSSQFPQ